MQRPCSLTFGSSLSSRTILPQLSTRCWSVVYGGPTPRQYFTPNHNRSLSVNQPINPSINTFISCDKSCTNDQTIITYNSMATVAKLQHKVHQVQRKKLIVTTHVQNVRIWLKHKLASVLAIGQLHHQSATAPGCTTQLHDTCGLSLPVRN